MNKWMNELANVGNCTFKKLKIETCVCVCVPINNADNVDDNGWLNVLERVMKLKRNAERKQPILKETIDSWSTTIMLTISQKAINPLLSGQFNVMFSTTPNQSSIHYSLCKLIGHWWALHLMNSGSLVMVTK